jgi:hypothetical protein
MVKPPRLHIVDCCHLGLQTKMKYPFSGVTASHTGGGWNRAEFPLKFNSLEFSSFTRQAGLTLAELTDYYCRSEETRRTTSPDDRRSRG